MLSDPVILVGSYCYELCLDELERLHVAAVMTETCKVTRGVRTN